MNVFLVPGDGSKKTGISLEENDNITHSKTAEQHAADQKLGELGDKYKLSLNGGVGTAIRRLLQLGFVGNDQKNIDQIHDLLPVIFDQYLKAGSGLTDSEKSILNSNKETIISILKPYYWTQDGIMRGLSYTRYETDVNAGWSGFYNTDKNVFVPLNLYLDENNQVVLEVQASYFPSDWAGQRSPPGEGAIVTGYFSVERLELLEFLYSAAVKE
jgi:hypothetical protein